MPPAAVRLFYHAIVALLVLGALFLSARLYLGGEPLIGAGILLVAGLAAMVYLRARAYTWRYLFPGLLGFAVFVLFPLGYTVYVSFTNYSSANLLRFPQVVRYFETETYLAGETRYPFALHRVGGEPATYVLVLTPPGAEDAAPAPYATEPFALTPSPEEPIPVSRENPVPDTPPLALREVIPLRGQLQALSLVLPDETILTNTGLREFGPRLPLWRHDPSDDSFTHVLNGARIVPDTSLGRYVHAADTEVAAAGTPYGPGFRAFVGLSNYTRVFTDKGIQGPFIRIFIWTIVFALGSVALSLAVGMTLAVLLEWKELQGRKLYRTLLVLPYAVPAFISILIFKGLFNQNFGEINLLLNALFGIRPEWFADPFLAKVMILIVNTWLGFPYMMIVCTGILQSVPDTIYEASAIDGSNALHDFFQLTLPLIWKPLFPLLVASFAFNFNNFLLIYLLTGGGPDMVGAATVAGQTDILVSYTFRIAFRDTAQNFGYASAIATVIFLIVALLAWWNLKHQKT
jgi:maltose/maltodextrin transport system permease protein